MGRIRHAGHYVRRAGHHRASRYPGTRRSSCSRRHFRTGKERRIMTLTLIEFLQLVTSTGVLGMGAGAFKWAVSVENRITAVETRQETRV